MATVIVQPEETALTILLILEEKELCRAVRLLLIVCSVLLSPVFALVNVVPILVQAVENPVLRELIVFPMFWKYVLISVVSVLSVSLIPEKASTKS